MGRSNAASYWTIYIDGIRWRRLYLTPHGLSRMLDTLGEKYPHTAIFAYLW